MTIKNFKWYDPEEQCPPPGFDVLIYCYGTVEIGQYLGDGKWDSNFAGYGCDVQAWMVLPEGPEE